MGTVGAIGPTALSHGDRSTPLKQMNRLRAAFRSVLVGLVATGCVGVLDEPATPRPEPSSSTKPRPSSDRSGAPSPPGMTSGTPLPPAFSPAPIGLPRLSSREFNNSLFDLFGAGVPLPAALESIPRVAHSEAIGATSAAWSDAASVKRLAESALAVAAWIWKDQTRRQALGICIPATKEDPCIRGSLAALGGRIWRRPLTPEEIADLLARVGTLAGELRSVDRAFETVFASLLASPHHVYRVELGELDSARPGWVRITDWEMASRLSFALWESTPDEMLLAAARDGALRRPEGIAAAAERMLRDPRSVRAFEYLFGDTFHVEDLESSGHDHPMWTASLLTSMREELRLMVLEVMEGDRDYRELLTRRTTFVNSTLARFYGLPVTPPMTDSHVAADLPPERRGILTTGALLALNGADGSSPIFRGRFVRTDLLCQPIPEPPDNLAEAIAAQQASQTTDGTVTPTRYAAQERLKTAPCNACHQSIDPIGLGFEKFDVIGAPQASEAGIPTSGQGWLDDPPAYTAKAFDGPVELAELLASSPRFAECAVRSAYARLARRPLAEGEEPLVAGLAGQFQASGFRYRGLLAAIVASEGFRFARGTSP